MSGGNPSPTFLTDEEEELEQTITPPPTRPRIALQGVLSKWTNYIHGWQDRFMILKDGSLSYYKSEQELSFGCRGSISILKATIRPHDFDECRFDVSVNDCVWYLRATSPEEKTKWVDALEQYKMESGYGSESSLQRYGSAVSIASNNLSTTSGSSFRKGRGLKVKLAELETYRDILVQQIDKLQKYFDACTAVTGAPESHPGPTTNSSLTGDGTLPGLSSVDFRGEALTFKATTSGVLTAISHCIEVMSQREDIWRKRVDAEVEKRKKVEEYFKQSLKEAQDVGSKLMIGPDCEEGPHSAMKEDEFFDAVELGLDRLEQEEAYRERLKEIEPLSSGLPKQFHPLHSEIDRITMEQLHYARLGVGEGDSAWELFAEDGEMRMYKREEEVNGLAMDPLKAVHTVKGFTGHEMCQLFFSPEVRMEWEMTVDQMKILETISDDTIVFLQIHKRIWPATQRDAVFWSHIRQVPDPENPDAPNIWIVCNNSTPHTSAPENTSGKYIRIFMTVSLTCQTIINPRKSGAELTRDDITCKITYCSVVNPGGWAPSSVLRSVYKREYPKFLKKFTHYVQQKVKNKPIMF